MKKLKIYCSLIVAVAFMFTSCSKDDETTIDDSKATLSFGAVLNDLVNNKSALKQQMDIPECSDDAPAFVDVVLTGTTNVGSMDEPLRVSVNPNPADYDDDGVAEYFTDEHADLQLDAGPYTLEWFVVRNASEEVLWIAPMADGSMANFVDNPLPMNFNLGNGVKKYVDVEVLCFDDRVVNEYGYMFFDIEQRQAFEYCFFANYCDANGRHYPGRISVDVWLVDENGERNYLYEDRINRAGFHGDDIYAEPLCLTLPNLAQYADDEEYIFYEVTLINWARAYGVVGRGFFTESGALSRNEVMANYTGEDEVEYDHIRFGNCQ